MTIKVNGKEFSLTKRQAVEIQLACIMRYNALAERNEYNEETPSMKLLTEIVEGVYEEYIKVKGAKK